MVTIRSVQAWIVAPQGIDLVVVKVETSEPCLYGLGCATFTQRATAVVEALATYLAPLVVGRDASRIEDLWTLMVGNGYWRRGPVLNNAVSGIDMALWDIKGKVAGLPLYQVLGGACRDRVDLYRHADGRTVEEVIASARAIVARGHRHVRCQIGGYGGAAAMVRPADAESSPQADDRVTVDPDLYVGRTLEMLLEARRALGNSIEILHDIHERVPLPTMIRFARDVEPARLFFLEDPLQPEQGMWLRNLRAVSTTPIALGELFTTPEQWLPLIGERLIDFIRVHLSMIGGLTPARKLAALCEAYGVRTAFHGPGDLNPVGHAVNLHLDMAIPNFGIQEIFEPTPAIYELFPGFPDVSGGSATPPEAPGIGVDFVAELVAKYPPKPVPPRWTRTRLPDGTAIFP